MVPVWAGLTANQVQERIEARAAARSAKDFKAADGMRAQLADVGVIIMNTPKGTTWRPGVRQLNCWDRNLVSGCRIHIMLENVVRFDQQYKVLQQTLGACACHNIQNSIMTFWQLSCEFKKKVI